jgi:peptide deformylase
MIKDVRIAPDPILQQQAHKVRRQRINYLREVSKDLTDTVKDHEGLGLAAPQIGVRLRMVVVDISPPHHLYAVFINPEITYFGDEKEIADEGCLSLPGMLAKVERSKVIHVKWDGGHRPYAGLVARIIQHEVDHLNGVLLFDRAIVDQPVV